ncbi:MAG: hypothetical protein IPK19_28235 [Chloroflexi bacterium]|nr:hypothetical protein [Chloroflexota bacterium]
MSGSHSSSGRADPAQEIFAMSDPMRGQGLLRAVKRLRRVATWLVALAACAVLAVSASAWPEDGIVDILVGDIGLILLAGLRLRQAGRRSASPDSRTTS